ncbi:MAG: hypothetical protein KDC87_07465 [Planctomycetes bacterium]|nr:hypothetical protein [Planctomycetota bacterium]MCB9872436.1 hypothetical protein [Planctomycetota bacterium]MCB9888694.1 hypothetical protein [Planctomycetota bacterium]
MSEGARPGGLTALAIINFCAAAYDLVFGTLATLAVMLVFQSGRVRESVRQRGDGARTLEMMDKLHEHAGFMWATAGANAVCGVLLLIAGIGYLKQRRRMGRGIGNLYAVVSLLSLVSLTVTMPDIAEEQSVLSFLTLLVAVYPLLTLFLLNVTFKEDFVN